MSDLDAYLAQLRTSLDVTPARAEVILAETLSHLEAKVAELQEAGASREEAVQAAIEEFGDPKTTGRALTQANGRHRAFRRIRRAVLLLCCVLIGVPAWGFYRFACFRTHLAEGGSGIVTHPQAARATRSKLPSLRPFDPSLWDSHQLQGRDLRALDLQKRRSDLLEASFDSHTQWPAELPTSFSPARVIEIGKSPGLGVRALHRKGITGRGVSIAIIDMSLLVDHAEYEKRLRLYEELHSRDEAASTHGTAVASIAVGKTVGVAPEADLYYIADYFVTSNPLLPWVSMVWQRLRGPLDPAPSATMTKAPSKRVLEMADFQWTARGIRRVLEINRKLPQERKIRVISIEIGWAPGQTGYEEVTAAVEQARKAGVFVISSSLSEIYGMRFHGLGRKPLSDPEKPASYSLITDWGPGSAKPTLLIPMDSRTTAAPTGGRDYAFYRHGGWSWVTPYLAGLYALACQVRPDITPELFWTKALETGTEPDYSMLPRVSRESVRAKMVTGFDTSVAATRKRQGADGVRKMLATTYREATGKPLPEVGEMELRELMIEVMIDHETERYAGREARIVNPLRLMEALQK